MVLWSGRGISKRKSADRKGKTRVGTLKTQVIRGGGLCGVWLRICHVIGHMMTDDAIVLWDMGALGPLSRRRS